jgi:DNA-binding transcriptional LysR family regulator
VLNLNELRVFLMAAETENFSEAGRRLGMTQPAVSQQIRALEERFGIELFQRFGRHVALTDTGRALVPMGRDLLDRGHQLEESVASLRGEVVGQLRIGCSTAAGKYILPRLLAGLRSRHPQVEVVCHVTTRRLALDLLRTGEVQVALTSLREPIKGIEYRPFLTDRIILITPPDHPWVQRTTPVRVAELTEERFVAREEGSGTIDAVREGLAHHDLTLGDLQVHMTLGNSEAIRMAVAEGLGVAFVSAMVAAEAVAAGSVATCDVEGLQLSRTLSMARDVSRPASRVQSAFWDYSFSPENEELRRRPASAVTG